jgi:hypothetical protein
MARIAARAAVQADFRITSSLLASLRPGASDHAM